MPENSHNVKDARRLIGRPMIVAQLSRSAWSRAVDRPSKATPLSARSRQGEFDLDLFQHPRQRDGEREEGRSRYGELFISVCTVGLRGHCQLAALAPGARNAL